jgi:hypothetical protein
MADGQTETIDGQTESSRMARPRAVAGEPGSHSYAAGEKGATSDR